MITLKTEMPLKTESLMLRWACWRSSWWRVGKRWTECCSVPSFPCVSSGKMGWKCLSFYALRFVMCYAILCSEATFPCVVSGAAQWQPNMKYELFIRENIFRFNKKYKIGDTDVRANLVQSMTITLHQIKDISAKLKDIKTKRCLVDIVVGFYKRINWVYVLGNRAFG